MRKYLFLTTLLLINLQGCVVPAAVESLQHYTHYEVITTRQIDAQDFRVLVAVEHQRGAFDPLGGHGARFVTTSVDLESWHLSLHGERADTQKTHSLHFETEAELNLWKRRPAFDLDIPSGRVRILPMDDSAQGTTQIFRENLRIMPERARVSGVVQAKECSASLPALPTDTKIWRSYIAGEQGAYLMLVDEIGNKLSPSVVHLCDGKPVQPYAAVPWSRILGFGMNADGNLRYLLGTLKNAMHNIMNLYLMKCCYILVAKPFL